jgi:hypothetical protein
MADECAGSGLTISRNRPETAASGLPFFVLEQCSRLAIRTMGEPFVNALEWLIGRSLPAIGAGRGSGA